MARPHGWTIWLTGLPGAGKTTLARAMRRKLGERGIPCVLLDSDELRDLLIPQATYAPEERDRFYARLVDLAAWLAGTGENVLIAATGSRRRYRAAARARLAPRFAEIWVRCPAEVCRARDPKGLYRRAAAGLVANLPGFDDVYEPPAAPEASVDADRLRPDEAAEAVLAALDMLAWRPQPPAAVPRHSETPA